MNTTKQRWILKPHFSFGFFFLYICSSSVSDLSIRSAECLFVGIGSQHSIDSFATFLKSGSLTISCGMIGRWRRRTTTSVIWAIDGSGVFPSSRVYGWLEVKLEKSSEKRKVLVRTKVFVDHSAQKRAAKNFPNDERDWIHVSFFVVFEGTCLKSLAEDFWWHVSENTVNNFIKDPDKSWSSIFWSKNDK